MKVKSFLFSVLLAVSVCLSFSSCSTKQQAINQLEDLSIDLRDHSHNYSIEEWKDAAQRYVKIKKKINEKDYSAEQRERIGELEGNCLKYIIRGLKQRVKNFGSELNGLLNSVMEGISDWEF